MQAIKCSTCRELVFWYDGNAEAGFEAGKATYPDGSKPVKGRRLKRHCGHGNIFKHINNSLYIDGETETPTLPESDWLE